MAHRFMSGHLGLVVLSLMPSQARIAEMMASVNWKLRILNAGTPPKTTRDHTGTTPGAEEAHFVGAYARVASANLEG